MKTININGKEYTKEDIFNEIAEHFPRHEPEQPKTPTEIATKYVKGQHDALTDSQEIKDLAREIEEYKNQPPTVRPMSELKQGETQVVFIVANTKEDSWAYGIGTPFNLEAITVGSQSYFKDKNYSAKWSSSKLTGWLYELPNPTK